MPKDASPFPAHLRSPVIADKAAAACEELRRSVAAYHLPFPPEKLCEELYIAAEEAAKSSAKSVAALRDAVERFTAALKDEGASPEAVLIALKTVINSRTFIVADARADGNEIRQQISTWSIEAFFKEKRA